MNNEHLIKNLKKISSDTSQHEEQFSLKNFIDLMLPWPKNFFSNVYSITPTQNLTTNKRENSNKYFL